MEHVALYRQFRPITFDEVVEQSGTVTSLTQAIKTGKTAHAYLFAGQRGTGKTSIAKIFARAVNCEHQVDGNPCNECETCKAILNGTLIDVIEMDAASNNGVDNIRRICDEVVFTPVKSKYKVYIIDEVHMLSPGGFNALLKTLEEPPKHAIFILATTELHRIPATIVSRCQKFNFKRISNDSIASHLRHICEKEHFQATDDALMLIASFSDGAMRDAISLLDQVAGSANGKLIDRDTVLSITGVVDDSFLLKMSKALIEGDYETIIVSCDELANSGRDISRFAVDLAAFFRDLLVVRMMPDPRGLVKVQSSTLRKMYELVQNVAAETLVAFISKLSTLISDLHKSSSVRTLFEITLINLCGRKVKVDPVPLVIPDFVERQAKVASQISSEASASSVETIAFDAAPAPVTPTAPAPQAEAEEEEQPIVVSEPEPATMSEAETEAFASVSEPPAYEDDVNLNQSQADNSYNHIIQPEAEQEQKIEQEAETETETENENESEYDPDAPMENQIDMFSSLGLFGGDAASVNTAQNEAILRQDASQAAVPYADEPRAEIPITTAMDVEPSSDAGSSSGASFFDSLSTSFLDDIQAASASKESSAENTEATENNGASEAHQKPAPTTYLAQAMENNDFLVAGSANAQVRAPEIGIEADSAIMWRSIYENTCKDDTVFMLTLGKTKLKIIDANAYITFDNSYTREHLLNLTKDPLYSEVKQNILNAFSEVKSVYVATEAQVEKVIERSNQYASTNSADTSGADAFLARAKEMGIDTKIHFGDD